MKGNKNRLAKVGSGPIEVFADALKQEKEKKKEKRFYVWHTVLPNNVAKYDDVCTNDM